MPLILLFPQSLHAPLQQKLKQSLYATSAQEALSWYVVLKSVQKVKISCS